MQKRKCVSNIFVKKRTKYDILIVCDNKDKRNRVMFVASGSHGYDMEILLSITTISRFLSSKVTIS